MMTRDTLKRHLYHFGQFPDQYRTLIWRYLLKCPENVDLFQALIAKGTHPLAETLVKQKLTIEDDKEEASMIQSLSYLFHWSPSLMALSYLPKLIQPYVHLFKTDYLSAFEVIITIIGRISRECLWVYEIRLSSL
jgi:hypothetical protein